MSNKEQDRVWAHSQQKGADLVVMLALANRANDSGICWPGQDELAARARVNRRTAQRIVDRLVASGEVVALDRPGKSYIYAILVGVPDDEKRRRIELAKNHQIVTGDKLSRVTNKLPKQAKLSPPVVQIPAQSGQPVVHSYAQNCTRTIIEPSVEPSHVHELYLSVFSEPPISGESGDLDELATIYSMDDIKQAMKIAKSKNSRQRVSRKVAYMSGILQDWKRNGKPENTQEDDGDDDDDKLPVFGIGRRVVSGGVTYVQR